MGEWGELKIGGWCALSFKNYVPPNFCFTFQESDRFCAKVPSEEWGGEVYYETQLRYTTSISVAKTRLSVMGYGISKVEEHFKRNLTALLESLKREIDADEASSDDDGFRREIKLFRGYTFERWLQCLKYLRRNSLSPLFPDDISDFLADEDRKRPRLAKFLEFFTNEYDNFAWGLPNTGDLRYLLVGMLAGERDDDEVALELGNLVDGGWLWENEPVVSSAWDEIRSEAGTTEPVLVLTEGSSDATILRKSLNALFPHLAESFRFLDFASTLLKGGAPSVIEQLKAFAAAGLRNRILAILDNDSAAKDAMRALKGAALPSNFKVVQLPCLEIAKSYPTIGPQGSSLADVNGRAVQIEMFAGKTILNSVNGGELSPVVWKSFMEGAGTHQGELREKIAIQRELLEALDQHPPGSPGFPDLRVLWQHIVESASTLGATTS